MLYILFLENEFCILDRTILSIGEKWKKNINTKYQQISGVSSKLHFSLLYNDEIGQESFPVGLYVNE